MRNIFIFLLFAGWSIFNGNVNGESNYSEVLFGEDLGRSVLRYALEKRENAVFSPFLAQAAVLLMEKGIGEKVFGREMQSPVGVWAGDFQTPESLFSFARKCTCTDVAKNCNFSFDLRFRLASNYKVAPWYKNLLDLCRVRIGSLPPIQLKPFQKVFDFEGRLAFKCAWKTAFRVDKTKERCFFVPRDGGGCERFSALFMRRKGRFNYLIGNGFFAISLEFSNNRYKMVFLLPFQGEDPVGTLDRINVRGLGEELFKSRSVSVDLSIPRFEWKTAGLLRDFLKKRKKGRWSGGFFLVPKKSISRMVVSPKNLPVRFPLFVSLDQEARIRWDEEGGSGRAKVVLMGLVSGKKYYHKFIADRPFFFFLYERAHLSVLFSGLVFRVGRKVTNSGGKSKVEREKKAWTLEDEFERAVMWISGKLVSLRKASKKFGGKRVAPEIMEKLFPLCDINIKCKILRNIPLAYPSALLPRFFNIYQMAVYGDSICVRKTAMGVLEKMKDIKPFEKLMKKE